MRSMEKLNTLSQIYLLFSITNKTLNGTSKAHVTVLLQNQIFHASTCFTEADVSVDDKCIRSFKIFVRLTLLPEESYKLNVAHGK